MTNDPLNDTAVDRREETVVTQQPGYSATTQVTRDVAAERRLLMAQVARVVYGLVGILEIVLGMRFVLKLIAANPQAGFAAFIYALSGLFLTPFAGLVPSWAFGGMVLEVSTLIAMAVYLLLAWIVLRFVTTALDRPSARAVTRATREATPDGVVEERTTRTTQTTTQR